MLSRQEYTPWGDVRGTQEITETALDFTGQRRDDTGLLFYNARYYDPALRRFISGDSIVPGASGGVIGQDDEAKLTPLTVDFREPDFVSMAGKENRFTQQSSFWFQLDSVTRKQARPQMGHAILWHSLPGYDFAELANRTWVSVTTIN